jgi:hypothetical protein
LSWLIRFIWLFWGKQALVRETKRRTLAVYLRAIRATRWSVIGLLASFLILQLMMMSLVGALVTGIYLWDHDFQHKIEILFWIFAGCFLLPAIVLSVLMSERLWFRISGAKRLMDDLSSR